MENKKEAEPDGADSPANHSQPKTTPTPTSPPAGGSVVVETDDFGLPIRRYVGPPKVTEESATATTTAEETQQASAGREAVTPKTETQDVGAKNESSGPIEKVPLGTQNIDVKGSDKEKAAGSQVKDEAPSESTPVQADASSSADVDSSKPLAGDSTKNKIGADTQRANDSGKADKKGHAQKESIASFTSNNENHGVSEFSHQHLSTKQEVSQDNEDEGWQEMPAYARYDMYNDDDKLIAREHDGEDDETYGYGNLGGAGKGYTRVQMDEDAQSANSLDDNTQYLFKEAYKGTAMTVEDEEEARDAVSQMQATKDLLTEGQRIAYVGIVRLEVATLVKETETIEQTKKSKKEVTMAAEAMKMWGQKMMIRLYAHMDISEAEQVMIEQLNEHGVVPADLTPALHVNARVRNPMAAAEEESADGTDEKDAEDTAPPSYVAEEESTDSSLPGVNGDEKGAEPAETADKTEGSSPSTPGNTISPHQRITELDDDDEEVASPPPPYENHGTEDMDVKTPSQLPSTEKIDIDLRWTVLCDLFLILIADSVYDARSRVLLERVAQSLEISWLEICRFEKRVTDALEMQQAAEKENWNEEEHMETRRKRDLKKRYMMMGLATVGGGLVIGLSAGLLAPVIGAGLAAGFATIGVTGTSGFLGGVGGAAIITSGAVTTGSIIGNRAANRRTGSVRTFEYRPLHNNKRVNLIVTVSGWLTGKVDDVRLPFSTVDPIMGDLYSVLWEPEMLQSMGDTMRILATEALTQSIQQILGGTILTALMGAIQLPLILTKLSYLIDNPWAVSLDRATSAGKILADSLIERNLGSRPITLVGYSLGARVIYSCLLELGKRGAYGLVQNAYLFGSPVVVNKDELLRTRTVVSGRYVNAFNRNDWILGYLFRLTNGGIRRVAGLVPIDEVPWIENYDVTEYVTGHMDYRTAMPTLLLNCGWMVESEEFTEIEDPDPDNHDQRQRELINEIEEARRALEEEGKAANQKKGMFGFFNRKKKAERQEWELYEESRDNKEGKAGTDEKNRDAAYQGSLFDADAIRAELAKEVGDKQGVEEEIQVREIQSTLPPMKLDLSSPTSTTDTIRSYSSRRETKSSDNIPSPHLRNHVGGPQEEVQMTFDTPFQELKSPPPPPPKDDHLTRPGMASSQTLPNITLNDPWGDPEDDDFGKEKEISMTFA